MSAHEDTRRSWNLATHNHNAHKGDQAARLRDGFEPLFPEELELLGLLEGKSLVHLQCNAGQDTLALARKGARCTGVDLSDVAIAFARQLSVDSGIAATFVESELLAWLASTDERFDVAFSSYGAVPWIRDLDAWATGITRVLQPGGAFVYVEFHPLVWSFDEETKLTKDDYFQREPFVAPVADYVAASGSGLTGIPPADVATVTNTIEATSWQHSLAEIVEALVRAGLQLERFVEYPHANGCKVSPALVPGEGRTWVWPTGVARVPLMFGLRVRRP